MDVNSFIVKRDFVRQPAFKWAVDEEGDPYVITENAKDSEVAVSCSYDEYGDKERINELDVEDLYNDYVYVPNSHYNGMILDKMPETWKELFNDSSEDT